MTFIAPDLELEVAVRRPRGPLVTGRRPRRWVLNVLRLPGVALLVGVLVVPIALTVGAAFRVNPAVGLWGLPIGIDNFASVFSGDGLWAYGRTALWVVISIVLLALGLAIAHLTREIRWLWLPLVLPFGVAPLVAGVAFRLIFDPRAERGILARIFQPLGVESVTGYQVSVWLLLVSAFTWTWLGFIVSLFRASLDSIDGDPVKYAYLHAKVGPYKRFRRLADLIRPVALLIGVTIVVAAARLFDIVLIAVPESLRYGVEPAGVHWWRLGTSGRTTGEVAAFALPLAILIGVAAWALGLGMKHHRRGTGHPALPRQSDMETGRPRRPRFYVERVSAIAVTVVWLAPVAVLVATAVHSPESARAAAWLSGQRLGFDSFIQVWHDADLGSALRATSWVAAIATVLVLVAAAPLAYLLASRRFGSRFSSTVVIILVVLAVMPVQMYIGPLSEFAAKQGLAGTRVPLILVHVAAGLPFAILALRGALQADENSPAADALYGLTSPMTTLRRIWERAGAALVAVAVLEFVLVWNDFIITFLLRGPGGGPLSQLLWGEARQFAVSSGTVAAGAAIWAAVPVILLLLTWRRFVVPGLTGGVLR